MELLSELTTFKSVTGEVISVVRLEETFLFGAYTGCCMSGCPRGWRFFLADTRPYLEIRLFEVNTGDENSQ